MGLQSPGISYANRDSRHQRYGLVRAALGRRV